MNSTKNSNFATAALIWWMGSKFSIEFRYEDRLAKVIYGSLKLFELLKERVCCSIRILAASSYVSEFEIFNSKSFNLKCPFIWRMKIAFYVYVCVCVSFCWCLSLIYISASILPRVNFIKTKQKSSHIFRPIGFFNHLIACFLENIRWHTEFRSHPVYQVSNTVK